MSSHGFGGDSMAREEKVSLDDRQRDALREYKASLPSQLEVEAVTRLLSGERMEGKRCLDISSGGGVASHLLRKLGGSWESAASSEAARDRVALMNEGEIALMSGDGGLPFEDKSFDIVVVSSGVIESAKDDERLVAACHRVMCDGGVLVVCAPRHKHGGLMPHMRRVMGVGASERGITRDGYTEKEMFELLRTGFDVLEMRSYQRFFVEFVRALGQRREVNVAGHLPGIWSYRFAYQLDLLLFLTRGYMLALRSRRRTWRSRALPDLSVGGVVSGAVLAKPSI